MLRALSLVALVALPLVGAAQTDPITSCRTQHADDSAAHISYLEAALRALNGDTTTSETLPEASTALPTSREPATAELGAEQVAAASRAADEKDASVSVRIVASSYDTEGLGTFRTADGQVWRETSATAERRRLDPDREYDAKIERGFMGGYRLYVDGIRQMKTVRRIE